jgi:copper homeostasis protein (lipoprotein)
VAALVAGVLACSPAARDAARDSAAPADSLIGTFIGVLPCADCAGIKTVLRLYTETSGRPTRYEASETYLATKDGDRSFERTGRWTIMRGSANDPDATVYQLDFDQPNALRNFLKAGDSELRLLDREQRDIPSLNPHSLLRVPDTTSVRGTA